MRTRGGRGSDFEDGAALPGQIRPLAEQLEAELLRRSPWTARPAFQWARSSWAWREAKILLLDAWIGERGLVGARSERAVKQLEQLRPFAAQLRAELELPPAAELGAEVEEEPS